MSVWDKVLPHRLLINSSLRKASADLRSHIDEYKVDYELQIERCSAEIKQARIKKDNDFEKVKLSLIDELSKDADLFDKVQARLLEYVDLFLRRQCFNNVREAKKLEKQALAEYVGFLSSQMRLIGEKIDVLEERKDKLAAQAKVEDVKELLGLTGCDIATSENDDAVSLLAKVSELVSTTEMSNRLTRQALFRLRSVLQERVDLLPLIQYISWMIQQKILLSAQLKTEREKTKITLKGKIDELSEINDSVNDLGRLLDEQARIAREYWAVPLASINVEISYYEKKLKSLFSDVNDCQEELNRFFLELKDTNQQIQQMIRSHSDDNWKWERLQREKSDYRNSISSTKDEIDVLQSQISQVKSTLTSLKAERQQWYVRQQMLYSLCKKNNVYLISDGKQKASDEYRIIDAKLSELYQIENDANLSEEERFKRESAQIQQDKKDKVDKLYASIASAEKSQTEKNADLSRATKILSNSKSRDARFFLLKWFSETEEVSRAKLALQSASIQKKKADSDLTKLKTELATTEVNFDKQLEDCRPKPYRPFPTESEERDKLEGRRTELLDPKRKEKNPPREGGRHEG